MAVKLLVGAVFIWRFIGSQRVNFQHGSLTWWLADMLVSLLIVGRNNQFLDTWTFPYRCLSVLPTWQLTSPRASDLRDSKKEATVPLRINLRSYTLSLLPYSINHKQCTNTSPYTTVKLHFLKKVPKDFWTFLNHHK